MQPTLVKNIHRSFIFGLLIVQVRWIATTEPAGRPRVETIRAILRKLFFITGDEYNFNTLQLGMYRIKIYVIN